LNQHLYKGDPCIGKFDLFVSAIGNDKWSGRLPEPNEEHTDGPFATLQRARDVIREAKFSGELPGPLNVWIRGGIYHITGPIVFGPDDSAPVTYAAYPGEHPILDGGVPITGWHEEELNGMRVWVTELPDAAKGKWYFRQLFVNGERRSRTRLPKQDFYWMEDVPDIDFSAQLFDGSDTFKCAPGDIQSWKNINDVDVVAVHFWVEERMPIKSFDEETRLVKSERRSIFALKHDVAKRYAKYYVENIFEALCEPGQWYLDRKEEKLYYIPMPGEDMESTEVSAPIARQFIKLEGRPDEGEYVEFLRFHGLSFTNSEWCQPEGAGEGFSMLQPGIDYATAPQAAFNIPGVIYLEGARYCAVENCTISHIGWYGVELSDGCMANRIVGNEISDMGAGGIKLNGSDANGSSERRTGNNKITDNHISSGGRVFHSAVGILSAHSFGNEISHNHIHDLYYTGITCGWVWGYKDNVSMNNRIEKNHIHDLGHGLLSDMGGIYTLGVQPGTVIRGNLIHDIEKCNYGGWAIYPDEGSSHILIENNICYNTSSQGFHQHYGRENIVRNNIFAFGREGQVAYTREEPHIGFTFEKNIVITDHQPLYVAAHLKKCPFKSDANLFWDVSGGSMPSGTGKFKDNADWYLDDAITLDQWRELGEDIHSKIADPQFKDLANYDFTLEEGSPALALGFKPIDMSDVGTRRNND
jgi:parallel beta-helix repeat protein